MVTSNLMYMIRIEIFNFNVTNYIQNWFQQEHHTIKNGR